MVKNFSIFFSSATSYAEPGRSSLFEMSVVTRLANGKILRGHAFHREDLWVRDGVIIDPQELFWGEKSQVCRGKYSLSRAGRHRC